MRRASVIVGITLIALVVGCSSSKKPTTENSNQFGSLNVTVMRGEAYVTFATVNANVTGGSLATGGLIATTDIQGQCTLSDVSPGTYSVYASVSIGGIHHYGQNTDILVSAGSTTNVMILIVEEKGDMFPMVLGNWWAFDNRDTIEVGPIKIIDGVTTYEISPGSDFYSGYFTHGMNSIYQHGYRAILGIEHITRPPTTWIDLTATAGDCWTIRDWGTGCFRSEWEMVETPLGDFENCWKIELITSGGSSYFLWLHEGVGLVKGIVGSDTLYLTDYELH